MCSMRSAAGPTGQPARYVDDRSVAVTVATVPVNGAGIAAAGGRVDVVVGGGGGEMVVASGCDVVVERGPAARGGDAPLHAARASVSEIPTGTTRPRRSSTRPTLRSE